jgi:hypothetical protein
MVLYDQDQRVYPAELFAVPKDQPPPFIKGSGATHVEAYWAVRTKLLGMVPGELTET